MPAVLFGRLSPCAHALGPSLPRPVPRPAPLPLLHSYVWQPSNDGFGAVWIFAAHRFVGCLALMCVFSAAMLAVKGGYAVALILICTTVPFLVMFDK